MSITTEISRITKAKEDIRTSLVNKGATISETAKLDEYSAIIDEMTIGSGGTSTDSDGWMLETEKYNGGNFSNYVTSISFPKTGIDSISGACNGMTNLKEVKRFPNDVRGMESTFSGCTNLVSVPTIPNTVIDMYRTFFNCKKLIPPTLSTGVRLLEYCFYNCYNISDSNVPTIPNGVTNMEDTFGNCFLLTKTPTIPDTVSGMSGTFIGCTSLTGITNIPTGVTNLNYCFSEAAISSVPALPNTVTDFKMTFSRCKNLTGVTNIPNKVKDLDRTFSGCTSLVTVPTMPDTVSGMNGTFIGCTSLTGITNISTGVTNLNNCFSGCTSLVSIPTIPDTVSEMSGTCTDCKNLTGVTNIPSKVERFDETFSGCTSLKKLPEFGAPKKNTSTIRFYGTFKGCSSLEEIILNTHTNSNLFDAYCFSGCPSSLKIYVNEAAVDTYKTDSNTKNFTILPIEKRWYKYNEGETAWSNVIYGVRVKEYDGTGYNNSIFFRKKADDYTYLVYNTKEKRFETYTRIKGVTSETTVLQPDEDGYYKIMFDEPVDYLTSYYSVELFI